MIRTDSSHMLRSRVLEFLNQPHQVRKKSIFSVNQQLTDQQKMIILKKITSESDKYQFDLTYSLKNYQKASFLPTHQSESNLTLAKEEEKHKEPEHVSIQVSSRDLMMNQQLLTPQNNEANPFKKQVPTYKSIMNPKQNKQKLYLTFNQNDFSIQRDQKIFDKYSFSNRNNVQKEKEQKDVIDSVKEYDKGDVGKQQDQPSISQDHKNSNSPLILSKQYKDLFRKTSLQSKNSLKNNSVEVGSTNSKRRNKQQSNQVLYNSIKYQPIIHEKLKDPFSDDINEVSALRKRNNHDILSTKVSLATPPSQLHTLVKRNNKYFFEKSPQYKKYFSIAPSRNSYLRQVGYDQKSNDMLIHNQFYDSNNQDSKEYDENSDQNSKELEDSIENKTFSKDEFSHKYFKQGSYQRPSQSLSTQSNQTYDQNSTEKFANQTIQSIFKTQQATKKLIQNEYYNNDSTSFQLISDQNSLIKQQNARQEYEILNTQDTTNESNYDEIINDQNSNSITTGKQVIFSNKLIPNFVPLNPEVQLRANFNLNSSKMLSPQQEKQQNSLREQQEQQKVEKYQESNQKKYSVEIRNLGDFKHIEEKNKVSYEKFIFKIGEYEKNIQNLLINEQQDTPKIKEKKNSLPKLKIINSNKQSFENPPPGYYNLNSSTFQTNRGYSFTTAKKVSSIENKPQYIDKFTPINEKQITLPPQEETAEKYFYKLMNEVKRQVDKETRQIGQVQLKVDSIQDLNFIEQTAIDRYQTDLIAKMIQCKRHINNLKQHLRREDPFFKNN